MRDHNHGRARRLEERAQLAAERRPGRRVERGEGLVEEEEPRPRRERAREGDALALAAGELAGAAVEELVEPPSAGRAPARARRALVAWEGGEPVGDVLRHVEVREERVILEEEPDPAALRRHERASPASTPGLAGHTNSPRVRPMGAEEKLALIDRLEATLLGKSNDDPVGVALRSQLAARQLSPRHAQDLLAAFRMDVTKLRYRDWDDLIGYCTYSAMPVGRFVLDVHGESRVTWPANDALCAALQIINHLQDCGKDYRNLDRIYIPLDVLAETGTSVADLGGDHASPGLLACIRKLAGRTGALLRDSKPFSAAIEDTRLALEVAVIQTFAERLVRVLSRRDPLSERVHLGKAGVAGFGLVGLLWGASRRVGRVFAARPRAQDA